MPTYIDHICSYCNQPFKILLQNDSSSKRKNVKNRFCSLSCNGKSQITKIKVKCNNCSKLFLKLPNQIKKTKNNFCSKSCSAIYNNLHKTKGTRRSNLEIWLEKQLTLLYPDLKINFNKKDTINSELDIYIPSLKLAFELNGIYHYEPIHGVNKMNQIQNNDHRKILACAEKDIELCIIDVSSLIYFKSKNAQKYLDIIASIINKNS